MQTLTSRGLQEIFLIQDSLEIIWQGSLKFKQSASDWMGKLELAGMEELALKTGAADHTTRTVDRIADYRVTDRLEVHTDLVSAPGFKAQQEQCMTRKALKHTKMGARLAASYRSNGHLLAVARIATDRRVDAPLIQRDNSFYQSVIAFDDLMALHLLDQQRLNVGVPGHNQQAGGITIQSMNNPGPMSAIACL